MMTPSIIELLPCPFCGGEVQLFHDTSSDYESRWGWLVECPNPCDGVGPYGDTAKEAAALWNEQAVTQTDRATELEAI